MEKLVEMGLVRHILIGYAPIGSPGRPERDRTPAGTIDIKDPVIIRIGERLNVHPAVVWPKWAVQGGQIPIPFSLRPQHYGADLKAVVIDPLTPAEMQEIAGIDRNNRLIKCQVFLWKPAKDLQDLWDVDEVIASG